MKSAAKCLFYGVAAIIVGWAITNSQMELQLFGAGFLIAVLRMAVPL